MNRRNIFRLAAGAAAFAWQDDSLQRVRAAASATKDRTPEEMAKDEDYWSEIRQAYTIDRNVVNLNNGHVGPSPKPVQDALRRYLEFAAGCAGARDVRKAGGAMEEPPAEFREALDNYYHGIDQSH